MKKIILIRHAKSEWAIPGLPDIDRPLNKRGYADAHKISAELKMSIEGKTLFASSPAIRTMSTTLIFAGELNYNPENILIVKDLYEAEENIYMDLFQSIDDSVDSIFVFGHNPTISNVVSNLIEKECGELPTCSVSVITFQVDKWEKILSVCGHLELQLAPKKPAE